MLAPIGRDETGGARTDQHAFFLRAEGRNLVLFTEHVQRCRPQSDTAPNEDCSQRLGYELERFDRTVELIIDFFIATFEIDPLANVER